MQVQQNDAVVAAYLFRAGGDDASRNKTVCKIVGRAGPVGDAVSSEPGFHVRFADGHQQVALSQQLQPWYPL